MIDLGHDLPLVKQVGLLRLSQSSIHYLPGPPPVAVLEPTGLDRARDKPVQTGKEMRSGTLGIKLLVCRGALDAVTAEPFGYQVNGFE